ncbi:hypothetical protein HPG69_002609 [Diceros bicornis minor]|uniref:Uncharacterized protein n=1 Tax=Diceros bicornis minor TaxID=77932 RepID=A0A7J7EU52_DICBM|nr:hypothetical protein HPG69_002609 [Diceros bicornis minor]
MASAGSGSPQLQEIQDPDPRVWQALAILFCLTVLPTIPSGPCLAPLQMNCSAAVMGTPKLPQRVQFAKKMDLPKKR